MEFDDLDSIIENVVKEQGRKEDIMKQWQNEGRKKKYIILLSAVASIAFVVGIFQLFNIFPKSDSIFHENQSMAYTSKRNKVPNESEPFAEKKVDSIQERTTRDGDCKLLAKDNSDEQRENGEIEEQIIYPLESPYSPVDIGLFSISDTAKAEDMEIYEKEWTYILYLINNKRIEEALEKLKSFINHKGDHQNEADSILRELQQ